VSINYTVCRSYTRVISRLCDRDRTRGRVKVSVASIDTLADYHLVFEEGWREIPDVISF
jgi:hypothetical protein